LVGVLLFVARRSVTIGLLIATGALLAAKLRPQSAGEGTLPAAIAAEGAQATSRRRVLLARLFLFSRRALALGFFLALGGLAARDSAEAALPRPPLQRDHQAVSPAWRGPTLSQRPARPSADALIQRVAATFPEDTDRAIRILGCESSNGLDALTYDMTLDNGGPLQINRWWESYFAEANGWTWDEIVNDLDIHLRAARFVYDDATTWSRSGWSPWECYTSGAAGW
jgi:hypothetical protein